MTAAPRIVVVPCLSEMHRSAERELGARRLLPLHQTASWQSEFGRPGNQYFGVLSGADWQSGGMLVETSARRALPFHVAWRVQRWTPPEDPLQQRMLIESLRDRARRDQRALGVSVELFSIDPAVVTSAEAALADAGFEPSQSPRRYERTLILDLTPDASALNAGLHKTARRNIREMDKYPLAIRSIEDPSLAGRIAELMAEALSRTGADGPDLDWARRIEFSRAHPDLSRLVGLFRSDASGPASLLAFSWGQLHGAYAHYDASGATRKANIKVSLAYPLLWDLITWAKARGSRYFDFGGVTTGHTKDGEDVLGGISDFKRYFTREVVRVGGEWTFEPHPLRARLADHLSTSARRLKGSLQDLRSSLRA